VTLTWTSTFVPKPECAAPSRNVRGEVCAKVAVAASIPAANQVDVIALVLI